MTGEGEYKDTPIGRIPKEWDYVRIKDLTLKHFNYQPEKNPDVIVKYVDVSCISPEKLKILTYSIQNSNNLPSRARKIMKFGDIIFSTVRPYLKQISKVGKEFDGQICSTAFCVIRPNIEKVDGNFIYHWILRDEFIRDISLLQTGSNYPAISDNDILTQFIPLPPLPEQHKIAAILSTVDDAIAATDEVIAQVELLKKGLMQELLTKGIGHTEFKDTPIGRIPKEWTVAEIKNFVILIRNGISRDQTNSISEYPVTRIETISDETIDSKKIGYIKEATPEEIDDYKLIKSDILFSNINSTLHIGKTAIYDGYPQFLLHGMNLLLIRPDITKIDPKYCLYIFKIYKNRQIFAHLAAKAINQSSINQSTLGKVKIALPTLTEQHKIAVILSRIDDTIYSEYKYREELEYLKKGLMQVLLTGEKRVKVDQEAPANA